MAVVTIILRGTLRYDTKKAVIPLKENSGVVHFARNLMSTRSLNPHNSSAR